MAFEVEHGVAAERERYNRQQFASIWRSRKLVVAEHGGLSDIFAPIVMNGRVQAALVAGPFGRTRPTSSALLERWRWLTGRQGHPSDPEFARFLDMTLATLVLEKGQLPSFRRAVAQVCRLIANEGSGVPARYDSLRTELAQVRHVERMWAGALSLIDARTTRSWSSSYLQPWTLGIEQLPDQTLVGLAVNRNALDDPVDELVRRDAFQRACVGMARSIRHVVAGRVGTQGVMLLSALNASKQRKRQRMLDLADRLLSLARNFGFRLHMGLGAVESATLSENYQGSLAAAESALRTGARLVHAEPGARRPRFVLVDLERELLRLLEREPEAKALDAHVDRVLEAIGTHYGHRQEAVRTHLGAMLERLMRALLESSALDQRGFRDLEPLLDAAERDSLTVIDLLAASRRALMGLARAVQRPRAAHREQGLGRALTYIREHYAEPLTLPRMARIAGFAPNYFSGLFKKHERITFERYVRRLRIERAKLLLAQHELPVEQVARLSGFRERHYFNRVFRGVLGVTPRAYRGALAGAKPSRSASPHK